MCLYSICQVYNQGSKGPLVIRVPLICKSYESVADIGFWTIDRNLFDQISNMYILINVQSTKKYFTSTPYTITTANKFRRLVFLSILSEIMNKYLCSRI